MIPSLRFPEFTDEWQVKKLGDITQINPRAGSLPDDFVYIDLDSVKRGTLLKQNRISKIGSPSRAQRLLSRDDIIYQTVRPYQKNNFYFDKAGDYVASTGYAQIRAREGYYPRFVYTLLHTSTFVNKVLVRSTGTNYPAINSNDLAKVKVHTPSKPEQEKIADFLTAVDERIGVSEKKLELLETYKRGVMQQIFSQKIRFKDENGKPYPDWKEKAVSEFLKERKEYTSKGGDLEHISLTTAGVVPKSERYERDFLVGSTDKQYRITRLDDICYNPANLKFGVIARNKYKDGIFSPIYVTYVVNNADIGFVEYLVTSRDFIQRARKYEQGTVYERMAVSPQDLAKLKVRMPVIEEQQKIATFLTTLDARIAAEKSKLTATRQFKKALLQRMFV